MYPCLFSESHESSIPLSAQRSARGAPRVSKHIFETRPQWSNPLGWLTSLLPARCRKSWLLVLRKPRAVFLGRKVSKYPLQTKLELGLQTLQTARLLPQNLGMVRPQTPPYRGFGSDPSIGSGPGLCLGDPNKNRLTRQEPTRIEDRGSTRWPTKVENEGAWGVEDEASMRRVWDMEEIMRNTIHLIYSIQMTHSCQRNSEEFHECLGISLLISSRCFQQLVLFRCGMTAMPVLNAASACL